MEITTTYNTEVLFSDQQLDSPDNLSEESSSRRCTCLHQSEDLRASPGSPDL